MSKPYTLSDLLTDAAAVALPAKHVRHMFIAEQVELVPVRTLREGRRVPMPCGHVALVLSNVIDKDTGTCTLELACPGHPFADGDLDGDVEIPALRSN